MLDTLSRIAAEASEIIMKIYRSDDFDTQIKSDQSPVTKADLAANDHIVAELKREFDYPILSEEGSVSYDERKNWETYWLVDPLDGTKSFIEKNDDFTVNIALIEKGIPIAGVLTVPVTGDAYTASQGKGCFKNSQKIFNDNGAETLKASASRIHKDSHTHKFVEINHISEISSRGSSIKFALLAEGLIDVYPRFGLTSEWDTAAGHIVASEAGCVVYSCETGEELIYNKENILNPHFIACRKGLCLKLPY